MIAAAAGAGLAAALGGPAAVWLRGRRYRYAEEASIRSVSVTWVVPVAILLGALIAMAWADRIGLAAVFVVATVVLTVLAAIDVDVHRLPDKFTRPLLVGTVVALLVVALLEGDLGLWVQAVFGGLALGLFYFLLLLIGGAGMGMGDVKLAPSLGLLLGYLSWDHVVIGTVAAFLSAAVMAVVMLARGSGRKSYLAFGPHMAFGALVVLALPAVRVIVA